MERNRGNLEAQTGKHEGQTNQRSDRKAAIADHIAQNDEVGRTGKAIHHRHAIQQHTRCNRPQNEVFQARFRGANGVAADRRNHVKCERLKLKAKI